MQIIQTTASGVTTLLIREVPGLNLGPNTSYPDWAFRASPQCSQESAAISILN
jgi:hypothetical protein